MHFPAHETLGEMGMRVAVGLLLMTGSLAIVAAGFGSRRFVRLFLTGALAMTMVGIFAALAGSKERPLTRAESMAARAGEIVGAASVCDIMSERLVALGRRVIEDVRFGADEPTTRHLQQIHESAIYALAAKVSRHPAMCAAATGRFADLEKACLQDRLLDCVLTVPALKLPPR